MAPRIEIGVFETYELRSTEVRQHKENKGDCNGDGGRELLIGVIKSWLGVTMGPVGTDRTAATLL